MKDKTEGLNAAKGKIKQLFLADLANCSDKEIREHIATEYEFSKDELSKYQILIAYESVGDYGSDSSSFFLIRDKKTKQLFDVHGSHCSCYGFEGQFEPQETSLEYLKSDKFYFCCGGYDYEEITNKEVVNNFIKSLRK